MVNLVLAMYLYWLVLFYVGVFDSHPWTLHVYINDIHESPREAWKSSTEEPEEKHVKN